ncbi:MAG: hypothetical protein KF849_05860 [Rhizobiaceae bacterium]|nr:hypothetical protein [Rhizobiaceae bacterium]
MNAFLATVAEIVVHTPIWVWGLYALLLFLGFQRTRDSIVPLRRMLILPSVVALLAISSFVVAGLMALPAIVLGIVIGSTAGWHLESEDAVRRLPDGRIWLRGEWSSFAQLVAVLIFRYAAGVTSAVNPALATTPAWSMGVAFISAALSALFLGRAAARLRTYMATTAAAT